MKAEDALPYIMKYEKEHPMEDVVAARYFAIDWAGGLTSKPRKKRFAVKPVLIVRSRLYAVGDDVPRFSTDGRIMAVRANLTPKVLEHVTDREMLAEYFPEVKPFIKMQMCDEKGLPRDMYGMIFSCVRHAFSCFKEYIMNYMRMTEDEAELMRAALVDVKKTDREAVLATVKASLEEINAWDRWKAEADAYLRMIRCE